MKLFAALSSSLVSRSPAGIDARVYAPQKCGATNATSVMDLLRPKSPTKAVLLQQNRGSLQQHATISFRQSLDLFRPGLRHTRSTSHLANSSNTSPTLSRSTSSFHVGTRRSLGPHDIESLAQNSLHALGLEITATIIKPRLTKSQVQYPEPWHSAQLIALEFRASTPN
jgi:hypothetical protein